MRNKKLQTINRQCSFIGWCLLLFCLTSQVFAHAETDVAGGFVSGFLHPIYGLDHLAAMVAVGLWGAQLRSPAIWVLPVAFPMVMAVGGFFGLLGGEIAITEIVIALSALVLGLAIAGNFRPPLWVATLMVGVFAFFHGYAHGVEVPASANPLAYGVGFVLCTGLLHLSGIVLGLVILWPRGHYFIRVLGGLIGLSGLVFIYAIVIN